jgi:hypothetical protein
MLEKWLPGNSLLSSIFRNSDQSQRSPLKVAIIPTFRGIVVQVRIFGLKRAKIPFSAEISLLGMAFLPFSAILTLLPYFGFSIGITF